MCCEREKERTAPLGCSQEAWLHGATTRGPALHMMRLTWRTLVRFVEHWRHTHLYARHQACLHLWTLARQGSRRVLSARALLCALRPETTVRQCMAQLLRVRIKSAHLLRSCAAAHVDGYAVQP